MPGSHVFIVARVSTPCGVVNVSPTPTSLQAYVMLPLNITTASYNGGKTGTFYDALLPINPTTCGKSDLRLIEWKADASGTYAIGDAVFTVDATASKPKAIPFYLASDNYYQILGHCKGYCNREAEFAAKYWPLLTAHGVTPMKARVIQPPISNGKLDLDSGGAISFRNVVLTNSPGLVEFPVALRGNSTASKTAYYQAMEATILAEGLKGRAWSYVWDEPAAAEIPSVIAELTLIRANAPSLKTMVTTIRDGHIPDSLIDIYSPVINWLVDGIRPSPSDYAGKDLWPYASCMGSCGDNRASNLNAPKVSGPDTKLPDFLIDRPASNILDFFKMARGWNAQGTLYYESTEGYRIARNVDLFTDTFNFGGNGDGLLLYPGRPGEFGINDHTPLPSVRLKLIRWALENGN